MLANPFRARKVYTAKIKALASVATNLGCTLPQLAIAWAAKNPRVSTVILGASRPAQLAENLGALPVIAKLSPEVLAEIEAVLKNAPAAPATYGR